MRQIHRFVAPALRLRLQVARQQVRAVRFDQQPLRLVLPADHADRVGQGQHRLEQALITAQTAGSDAVITTGGVSVGEADFVRQLMSKLGEVLFWKIAMRPGRPMAFGKIGNAFFFGLPGNPVAVMVTFYQFVRDALVFMSGRDAPPPPLLKVPSAEDLRKVPGRTEYQRRILFQDQGAWKVRTTGQQGSGVLRSMSEANCFIVLEHERGKVQPGERVQVQPFEGLA